MIYLSFLSFSATINNLPSLIFKAAHPTAIHTVVPSPSKNAIVCNEGMARYRRALVRCVNERELGGAMMRYMRNGVNTG